MSVRDSKANPAVSIPSGDLRYLKLDQTTPQTVTGGSPVLADGITLGDGTITITQDVSDNLAFTDSVTGTKTLAQLAAGGGGITDHNLLSNLNWANAAHTIDADVDLNNNSLIVTEITTPANPSANDLKVYAKDVGGVTKLHTLDSAGTETELGSGGGATTWAELDKTVSDISDITTKSHTSLSDIGSNTHSQIDDHLSSTSNPHSVTAAQAGAVALSGNETIAGIKTFSTLPQSNETPTLDNELVTKTYVDTFSQGLVAKEAVSAATTANITLANEQTIDAVPLTDGDRCLVKDQTTGTENGIYTVVDGGAWTRAADYNADSEVIEGTFCYVLGGTENGGYQFVQTTKDPELGVDTLTFVLLNAPSVYTAGDGLDLAGVEFSLDLKANDGLAIKSTELGVDYDNSTLGIVSNKLAVKEDGILNTHIGESISVANGGTGLTALGTANQVLGVDDAGTGSEFKSIVGGSNVTVTHSANEVEISASVSGVADYLYVPITFHSHLSSSYTATNMAAAETAIAIYKRQDLTGALQYRVCVHQAVAGYSTATLNVQYSVNGSTWYALGDGALSVGTGTGLKTGAWTDIDAGGRQDVRLRLVTAGGDEVVDPQFREIWVEVKYNASIVSLVSSDTVDKEITIHSHPASTLTWTNMPEALTEFVSSYTRSRADLSNATHYRIYVSQAVAGYAGADINLQYSLDGTTWVAADSVSGAGELDIGTGTGQKIGAWAALKDSAKQDVFLRLVGKGGNAVSDPGFRQVKLQFREHTYGQGVTGNDTEVLFNDAGSTGTDSGFTFDKANNILNLDDDYKLTFGTDGDGYIKFNGTDLVISANEVSTAATVNLTTTIVNSSLIIKETGSDEGGYLSPSLIMGNPDAGDVYLLAVHAADTKTTSFVGYDIGDESLDYNYKLAVAGTMSSNYTDITVGQVGLNSGTSTIGDRALGGGMVYAKVGNANTFTDLSGDMESAARSSDFDGRYLYVGTYYEGAHTQDTFRIYDCIDPALPVLVSPTTISGTSANAIKGVRYYNNHVYITYAASGANAFRIIDVTDRANPVVKGGAGLTTLEDLGGGATLDIDTVNSVAYLASSNSVYSVDVSDPTAPAILDTIDFDGSVGLWTCKYSAGYVYVAGRNNLTTGNTLHIVDVSNPASLSEVTPATPVDLQSGCWTICVDGNYVYVAAGGSFTNLPEQPKFYIIDVTDKADPSIVTTLQISMNDCSYIRKVGDYCYMTCWDGDTGTSNRPNLFVINVADVDNPFVTQAACVGNLPVNLYPAFSGKYIYMLFAPFGRVYPFLGVVSPGQVLAGVVNTDSLSIGSEYTFPTADGTSGQVLTTDGSGAITFETPTVGASLALDNLVSVAINTGLVSDTNDTDDLGTDAIIWRDLYVGGLRHGLGAGSSCGLDLLMTGTGYTSQINLTGTDYTHVFIQAGDGVDSSKTGRNITLKGGDPYTLSGANTGGSVYLTGANGTTGGVGGSIVMSPGTAASGANGVAIVNGKFGIIETGTSPTYYTYFTGGDQSADVSYTLPTALPASSKFLQCTDAGVLSWEEASGGSGASTALDNLADVAINTSLVSDTDSTDNLGSSSVYWANAYLDKIYLDADSTIEASDVDGWNALVSAVAPLTLTGSTDAVQLKVIGNSSQTNHIFEVTTSTPTTVLSLSNGGDLTITGSYRGVNGDNTEPTYRFADISGGYNSGLFFVSGGGNIGNAFASNGSTTHYLCTASIDEVNYSAVRLLNGDGRGDVLLGTDGVMTLTTSSDVTKIITGDETSLETDEVIIDLSALAEGLEIRAPILAGNAYSSLPDDLPFPYATGFYDRLAIFDKSERDEVELLFANLDFSQSGGIGANLADGYIWSNWDFNPYETDTYALGTDALRWTNLFLSNKITMTDDDIAAKPACTVTVASSVSRGKDSADFVCDGTADDVQIQAATDLVAALSSTYPTSIGANGKGKVVLLEGVYNVSTPIKIKPGINYEGMGASTVIKATASFNDNLFEFDEPTVNPSAGTIFRQMWFDGNKDNNTSGTAIDTKVGTIALWDLIIEDCYFFDFDGTVLKIDDPWGFRLYNSIIEDCTNEAVVITAGASKITGASIENCKIIQVNAGNATHCISITNCEGIKLIGNELNTSGTGATVLLSGGGGHIIQGNRFGASTNCLADIGIANQSNFNVITGNWIIGSKAGVYVEALSTDNLITSNTFNSITNVEINDAGTNTVITGNRGDDAVTNRDFFRNNAMNVLNGICEFRLTLTSGTPITTADVTAAGTIYMTPYKGNRISLFDGTNWKLMSSAEVSLSLTATSGKNYDVFAYDNAGTVTLESVEWTNDTTRATALVLQDGVLVKSGATTRRYLGTIRASGTNTTEDSILKRYVWNYYNRVSRNMYCTDTTDTWDYTTATWRQANGAAANKVEFVLGYSEDIVTAESFSLPSNSGNILAYSGIGVDATNANSALLYGGNVAAIPLQSWAKYDGYIAAGYHYLAWLEISEASGTTTWRGDSGGVVKCGLTARIMS